MKVTQEKLPASQVGLEIEIPSDLSQKTYERVIQQFTRSANIPGFRKGKVPRQILIQRLGVNQIKQAVLEELVQEGVTQAIQQTEIAAIGNPQLRTPFDELVQQYEPGRVLKFSAAVDVQPEVKLNQYQGFQAQVEEIVYDPNQVDQVLEDYRSRVATLVPVEGRSAQLGDVTIVDYQGRRVDEENPAFPGNEAQDFQVELAPGRFIEGFIEGIVGMTTGETKEIPVQFPADYPTAELAGKSVIFSVTLKELKEKELPDLDDDFAQEISDFETLAELRASLETRYQQEAKQKNQRNKEQALIEALLQQVEVDLPETLIRQEVDYLLTQMAVRLQSQGMDVKQLFTQDTIPRMREQAREEAIVSLKRSFALKEIAKRESIQVEPTAIDTKLAEVKSQYQGQEVDEARLREVVADDLLVNMVMEWLEAHSTVEFVPPGVTTKGQEESVTEPVAEQQATDSHKPVADAGEVTTAEPAKSSSKPTKAKETSSKRKKA